MTFAEHPPHMYYDISPMVLNKKNVGALNFPHGTDDIPTCIMMFW